MLKKTDFYYFSPTGGTKKVGDIFSKEFSEKVRFIDLGERAAFEGETESEIVVVAVPVFGGRIPRTAAKKLKNLSGVGKKAVTIVVYGSRAYEDSLLELNDILSSGGFKIVASGAFVAQHSMASEIGAGRPDEKDTEEIKAFAQGVLKKLDMCAENEVQVSGNQPYKQEMSIPAVPISTEACASCGKCEKVCPEEAISINENQIQTDITKCILCLACTYVCPKKARVMPPPLQENLRKMLSSLKGIRRENETIL